MAQKDRSTLASDIATQFATNGTNNITALVLRNYSTDDVDSAFNLLDDDTDSITEGTINKFITQALKDKILTWTTTVYATPANFTPGVTTNLTLSSAVPGDNKSNVRVYYDAAAQGSDEWSISGTTITFTSPIPVGIIKVEIHVYA